VTHPEILPLGMQLGSLAILLCVLGWVVWLIRTEQLSLRDSLLWLVTTLAATVVTAFPQLLGRLAHLIGVQVPANALFGAGLLYLALNVLSVTLVASASSHRVRRLAQECALLRADLEALRAERAQGAGARPGGAAPQPGGAAAPLSGAAAPGAPAPGAPARPA
jgi:hypothetical protein